MNSRDLVAAVRERESSYTDCPVGQARVYACEDVCEEQIPSRLLSADEARDAVERISHAEDIDPPRTIVSARFRRTAGAADIENRTVHLAGPPVPLLVLVHELAHFTTTSTSHGSDFLHEMVSMTRTHVSLDHASLLHTLYTGAGLAVPPWPAIRQR